MLSYGWVGDLDGRNIVCRSTESYVLCRSCFRRAQHHNFASVGLGRAWVGAVILPPPPPPQQQQQQQQLLLLLLVLLLHPFQLQLLSEDNSYHYNYYYYASLTSTSTSSRFLKRSEIWRQWRNAEILFSGRIDCSVARREKVLDQ